MGNKANKIKIQINFALSSSDFKNVQGMQELVQSTVPIDR